VALIVVVLQWPSVNAATTFTVNSLNDTPDAVINGVCADSNGVCTLRAAIEEANFQFGDDTIQFSVTGIINLNSQLPALTSNINMSGPGSGQLTIRRNSGGDYRIFLINSVTTISGVTITNGRTPDSVGGATALSGAGIFQSAGTLVLRDVVVTANSTGNGGDNLFSGSSEGGWGGFGGGIYASGTLTMTDCVISNNTTGHGGAGGGSGGSGGRGAGIYFAPGTLTMTNVLITGNRTGDSGGGSGNSGYGGAMWVGGDFFPSQNTTVNMTNVTITNNSTGDCIGTGSGDAGGGGGIYLYQGTVNLTDSSVSNNHTGNGSVGTVFGGAGGSGGGIFNNGILTLRNSLVSGNTTGNSAPGLNNTGGGISNNFTLTLINSTVSGNHTGTGPNLGGGVYVRGTATVINSTITANSATGDNGNGLSGSNATVTVANSIIAGNGANANSTDLATLFFGAPTFISQGHNLIGNADGATGFNGPGDQVGTTAAPINPQLGLLQNNGGPTQTHALLSNSPALDAGDNALAKDTSGNPLLTDQRGAGRIADSADADATATVDIGAFELHQGLEDVPDQTTNEDTPLSVSFSVGDNSPAVSSVAVSSSNLALVPLANIVVNGNSFVATLQITPAANQSGSTTITFVMNFAGGGSDSTTFNLTVLPVNDAPSFTKGANQTINEDAGLQTVSNWATSLSAGPNEAGQTLTFTATFDNAIFSTAPAIDSSGTLTYAPAANASGVSTISVFLKDDGGTANGGQDTSAVQTFTITVNSVNDAPSFTKGPDITVAEDPGFQFVGWATNISAGPNEFDGLNFQITNNTNPGLFSSQPSITSAGTLLYQPAANASGSADITVVLKDTGGTANGGVDISAAQTFTITVTAVNDAPFISVPFDPATAQNTPLVFSTANFNAITVTDVDAGADPISVTLTATQGTLTMGSTAGLTFSTGDGTDDASISFSGTVTAINTGLNGLTFKPTTGFNGLASLQIGANDGGHNGSGGAKSALTTLVIPVRSGGRFSFNTALYGVNESGGTATITVLRSGGTAGTASVNYSTSNGTATSGGSCGVGVDYLPASGTFTWNNGDISVRQFTITICNDSINEGDETINLTLSDPTGTGSLGTQSTAVLTIGNDDGPLLLTEENSQRAIALDLATQMRDPFRLTNPFNMSNDQRQRVSLFVWQLGLLPGDNAGSVSVTARDSDGRVYNLPVEFLSPMTQLPGVTQVMVLLPDNVIDAPRDLFVKVTLHGPGSNEAIIKIAAP
jgi:CSLREA domain-containing protein